MTILTRLCHVATLTNVVLRTMLPSLPLASILGPAWKFMEDLLSTPREEECSGLQLEIVHIVRFIFDFASSDLRWEYM